MFLSDRINNLPEIPDTRFAKRLSFASYKTAVPCKPSKYSDQSTSIISGSDTLSSIEVSSILHKIFEDFCEISSGPCNASPESCKSFSLPSSVLPFSYCKSSSVSRKIPSDPEEIPSIFPFYVVTVCRFTPLKQPDKIIILIKIKQVSFRLKIPFIINIFPFLTSKIRQNKSRHYLSCTLFLFVLFCNFIHFPDRDFYNLDRDFFHSISSLSEEPE